jgi:hypothetical protein
LSPSPADSPSDNQLLCERDFFRAVGVEVEAARISKITGRLYAALANRHALLLPTPESWCR